MHYFAQHSINPAILMVSRQENCKCLLISENLLSSVTLFSQMTALLCQLLRKLSIFIQSVQKICAVFFQMSAGNSFTSLLARFLIIQIVNQNRPMIFFIQHHLICSHLVVVCNGATVSAETVQMVLDQYQTFHPS